MMMINDLSLSLIAIVELSKQKGCKRFPVEEFFFPLFMSKRVMMLGLGSLIFCWLKILVLMFRSVVRRLF